MRVSRRFGSLLVCGSADDRLCKAVSLWYRYERRQQTLEK